jgi:hypothetical protein
MPPHFFNYINRLALLFFAGFFNALDKQTILDVQKPAPCVNYPLGKYEGICSFNASNHIIASGVKRLTEEFPHHTSDFGTYSKTLNTYFKSAYENKTARLDADDLSLIMYPPASAIQVQPISVDIIKNSPRMHRFIKNITVENTHALLFFNITNHQQNHWFYPGVLDVPQYIEVQDQYGQINNYALVSVLNSHKYVALEPAFFQLRKALAWVFRVFVHTQINFYPYNKSITYPSPTNLVPSKLITNYFNKAWDCHIDAFVSYNNTWYLMDDTTRWKALAQSPTNNSNSHPDAVLQALLHHYPGTPYGLVYAPVATTPSTSSAEATTLVLKRDTPRMTFAQSSAILLSCFILDTCFIGGIQCLLGQNPLTGLKIGTIFGMISFIYHSRHMAPLRKQNLTFTNTKQQLGPRAPIL